MNFSALSNRTLRGKALRYPLKLIPGHLRMPIWQGRLRGKKWIVESGVHGYWLGSYEHEKQRLFEKMIRPGSVVYDIGAHVGFYTLLAAEMVGANGSVIAFEPLPRNLRFLRAHVEINGLANVKIVGAAVSDADGVAAFEEGPNSSMGRIGSEGTRQVITVSLDRLAENGELPMPEFIKIDVEGAEVLVLSGARRILEVAAPTIFLATHGEDVHSRCCEFLCALGYELEAITGNNIDTTDEVLARKAS